MLKFLVLINFEQIPEALQAGLPNVIEAAQHPVVALSWWEIWPHPSLFHFLEIQQTTWTFLNEKK